jgi:hypothetical protein
MGNLREAIELAASKAQEEHQKVVRDRIITLNSQVFGAAATYDQVIVLAGYAAFFALWSGVAKDVSHTLRLAAVALMGISLMLYIAWTVMQMITRQRYEYERAALFAFAQDAPRFNQAWVETDARAGSAQMKLLRWWPWIFVPSLALGVIAGAVLTYSALAGLFSWPVPAS